MEGPYHLSGVDLSNEMDGIVAEHPFVSLTGSAVIPSGLQVVTTETRNGLKVSSYVSSKYYIVSVGAPKILLAQSVTIPKLHAIGELLPVPESVLANIFPNTTAQEAKRRVIPYYLSMTVDYRMRGYIGIGALLIYLGAMILCAGKSWRWARNIASHPVVKRVERWPDAAEIAMLSNIELASVVRYRQAGIFITDNFVIKSRFFSFNLYPFRNLLWAYKRITRRSLNGIPIWCSVDSVFVFKGGTIEFPGDHELVDRSLAHASIRAPWAFFGYANDLQELLRKDFATLCMRVEQRQTRS